VTRILLLFVLAHWGHHLLSSIIPPLLPYIRDEFEISVTQAGAVFSAFTIAYGVCQLPAGWLADRIGQRMLILLGVSGVALWGVLAGLSPGYWAMIIFMVLLGVFGGGYHPSSAPMVSAQVAPNRRGWALGVHQIGGTTSNLSAPLIAAGLATLLGWRSAFVVPGVVVVALGIVLYLLIGHTRPRAAQEAGHVGESSRPGLSTLVAYIVLGTVGQVFILSTVAFASLFAVDALGQSEGLAAALPFAVYLGGMPAGPLAGHYSDKLGASRVLIASGLAAGPAIYLLSLVTSVWISIPVLLALGALMFTLMPVSELYIINHTGESNRSTVMGAYYAASRGGSGFLTLGIGYIAERSGFPFAFAIAGAAALAVAAGCVLFLWSQKRRA
jgi:MFS family permease